MAETKEEFLARKGELFREENPNSYVLANPIVIQEADLSDFTNGITDTCDDLKEILESDDEETIADVQTALMGNIVGWGDDFQGSYPTDADVNTFEWNIDWGEIEVDSAVKVVRYSDIRFYKGL